VWWFADADANVLAVAQSIAVSVAKSDVFAVTYADFDAG
jgi:hypothetical protein